MYVSAYVCMHFDSVHIHRLCHAFSLSLVQFCACIHLYTCIYVCMYVRFIRMRFDWILYLCTHIDHAMHLVFISRRNVSRTTHIHTHVCMYVRCDLTGSCICTYMHTHRLCHASSLHLTSEYLADNTHTHIHVCVCTFVAI
jgi:hypothetical protein